MIECTHQACNKCGEKKAIGEFYVRKESGKRRSECKSCHRARGAAWAAKNIDKRREIALRWAKNNYPKLRANKAKQRAKDPLRMRKWSLENPERKAALNAEWKRRNKGKVTASTRMRQAAVLMATPAWADAEKIETIYIEAAKMRAAGQDVHVDHVVPLRGRTVCGLHTHHNLEIKPASVNASKGNRTWPDMP